MIQKTSNSIYENTTSQQTVTVFHGNTAAMKYQYHTAGLTSEKCLSIKLHNTRLSISIPPGIRRFFSILQAHRSNKLDFRRFLVSVFQSVLLTLTTCLQLGPRAPFPNSGTLSTPGHEEQNRKSETVPLDCSFIGQFHTITDLTVHRQTDTS